MPTIGDTHEFQFPAEPTRREKQMFSKHAGMPFTSFALLAENVAEDDSGKAAFAAVWDDVEPALILMAAQRIDPTVTYDQVMDCDGWTLVKNEEAADIPLEPSAQNAPNPHETPEMTESTSSPT